MLGNGVKENILPLQYVSFPDTAMIRYAQERGLQTTHEPVKVMRAVEVRQVAAPQGPLRQAEKASVPTRDPVKMSLEDVKKLELVRLVEVQKQEQKALAEPKTLAGAVRVLNELNAGRTSTGAQQRLRAKETPVRGRSSSSVRIVGEKKADPERERGEKPVVRTTP